MKKKYNLTITAAHPIIKGHMVYGQNLLPGLAYIDVLYQLVQKAMRLDYRKHFLKHLSIFNPLIVRADRPVQLKISFDKKQKYWGITIAGTEIDEQANQLQEKLYITAELHEETIILEEQINIEAMKQAATQCVDIETVYAEASKRGLVHQGMIKAQGNIYLTDPGYLIEVNVDEAYHDEAKSFLFHPTLIDGAAMALGGLQGNIGNREDLYLPIYYESFSCMEPLCTQCYARVSLSSLRTVNEILTMDIAFFNIAGKQVAQLKGITGKLVRFKGQINPDFKKEITSSAIQGFSAISETSPQHYFGKYKEINTSPAYIENLLQKIFSKHLKRELFQIDLDTGFFELGLESSQLLVVVQDIESAFDLSLSPTLLFENSNLGELIGYLEKKKEEGGLSHHPEPKEKSTSVPLTESLSLRSNTYKFYEHESYLQDHLVYNQPALMGITHPCLVLETYIQNNPGVYPLELRGIRFLGGPVTLKKEEIVHVHVHFHEENGRISFETENYVTDQSRAKPCCKGEYIGSVKIAPEVMDIEAMLSKSKQVDRDTVSKCYYTIKDFTIGPMLQTIESIFVYDKSTIIGKVCLSGKLKKGDVSHYIFDPLLLASCYGLNYIDSDKKSDNIIIPLMIERLTVFRPMVETAYIVKRTRYQKTDFVSFDAMVLTENGEIIAEIINASEKEVLDPSRLSNASFNVTSSKAAFVAKDKVPERSPQAMDIAIVGLAGRYPQSYDVEAFWENLRDGKDCITEIPKDRWDWQEYYSEDRTKPGYAYSKWGGFIDDVDRFDPLFFNISPREAGMMDPQERLFLEQCWLALEDAGYTREKLQNTANSHLPGQVGVYAGVMYQEYPLYAAESSIRGQRYGLGGGISSIATRVSYLCDFHGPSIAIDTMCSSSLTAIYMACQALKEKRIDAALAGGVNLTIHPNKYLMLSQGQFISSKGHCESFGKGGDGYIPGEGVGVLVLKRLTDAERDKDHIYAVIKGAAINHGGRAGGYTVPNPKAQSMVIAMALEESGIDPRTISYIEAHGTGTVLGDPIEIAGLTRAFEQNTKEKQFCSIGSVKSNIGHCEGAAGIAGVTKILLQLKYRQLVPSLHSKVLNPNIEFSNTPFVVQQELTEWKRPMAEINGEVREYPRIAGISSFGAGGSNAHVVIEEYIPSDLELSQITLTPQNPAIIVLSAKSEERLEKQAQQLLTVIQEQQYSDANLTEIAYTLQVGREAMEERLGIIAGSINELIEKLNSFVAGQEGMEDLFRGQVKHNKEALSVLTADEDMEKIIGTWMIKGKNAKLLALWVKGLNFDWNKLYGDITPRRISLPTYPFARERYWAPEICTKAISTATSTIADSIHPLLHQNTSDFSEQRFSSAFTGKEFFLANHVVKGQPVLPGVAYLEMARAAVEQAAGVLADGQTGVRLKNVVWARPIAAGDQPVQVHIGLFPEANDEIAYEIYIESEDADAEPVVHSQGIAALCEAIKVPTMDLQDLKAQCSQSSLTASQCYEAFRAMGIEYGTGHQGIEMVYVGMGQVLAKLSLPAAVSNTQNQFVLHPSMMDAALQASIGLMISTDDLQSSGGITPLKPVLPFALQELEIISKCTPAMWALVRYSAGSKMGDKVQKLDIDLYDEQGNSCIRMKGLSARVLEGEVGSIKTPATIGTLMLEPCWQEQAVTQEATGQNYIQYVVMLCEQGGISRERIETRINGVRCLVLESEHKVIEERFQTYAARVFEEIQSILKGKLVGKILIQIVVSAQGEQQLFAGLSGLLKTAQLENPKLIGQLIEMEPAEDTERIIEKLQENSRSTGDSWIRYQGGKRWVAGWSEVDAWQEAVKIPWKGRGVYLITGGAGGLGLIFAKEIVHKVNDATLILTGRSPLSEDKQTQLKEWEASGARIVYRQVDVTEKESVAGLVRSIQEEFGNLDGVIHSAGLIRDNFILKKTREELQEVLVPKVAGLVNLDQASKDLSLDFFICFSSGAGAIGNIGQADYATANAFMDAYAKYRNELVAAKQRQGKTLSINWPLWQEGGMNIDAGTEQMLLQSLGMVAMQTSTGIRALYQGLATGKDQVMVVEGNLKRFRAALMGKSTSSEAVKMISPSEENKTVPIGQDMLREKVENYFKKQLSCVIQLPVHHIEADAPLEDYGIDSVMVMELTNQLEETFGPLSKTLFFEYQTIKELTGYFLKSYRDQLIDTLGIEENAVETAGKSKDYVAMTETEPVKSGPNKRKRPRFASQRIKDQKENGSMDIAIIGVSGRYPQARNIQEFWGNLRDGKNCITEIPQDRWDHSLYFDEDKNKPGKTYSKWGGFLQGVDQFDPLFFNISPRDAEFMDPQERLFLECVFETIEDAGYTRVALSSYQDFGLAGNVGVYVGVMYEEYQLYGAQEQIQGRPVVLAGNPASIANRVSYFCNFHGPSMTVDTMCSSSLTAIHLACQSLQRGGCELAIAGGVNVSIHPNKYLLLSQGNFVSSKGQCESFGQGGDGYVPGEGVGAVLLKPLTKAIADGDHIYGIIKATAINHGGKTNGYTVPNPNAQASIIGRAYREAGIDPRMIGYIEAHGTGTSLGDPIEIAGLTKAFQEYTKDKQFCAIGSAKSNIGHCESAAGIAGVTKVLLQLKYRQLVPSLHSEVLNPNIDFSNTPFVVQQEFAEWKRSVVDGREIPRCAGISSFGAGGSNAHVVIEEYIANDQHRLPIPITAQNPAIIVLSAKNEARLQEQVQQLLAAIQEQQFIDSNLADMAYTLQVGREAMEERLAVIVGSIKELEEKLKSYVKGQESIENLYRGEVKRNKETLAVFIADEDMAKTMEAWISKRKYAKLLDLWIKGHVCDWNKLYGDVKPRRISLPTYPFARERYWVPEIYTKAINTAISAADSIHPLLQQNTSDFSEQRFSSTFTGKEFFLANHVVKGQPVLPGVAYLEMARAAVEQAVGVLTESQTRIRLKNVVWIRPIVIGEQPVKVHIGLIPEDNGEIAYEIYSQTEADNEESVVHSQGRAVLSTVTEGPILDLPALQAQCSQDILSSTQCYEAFSAMGLEYGSGHQGIVTVHVGSDQVLAKLSLPSSITDTKDQFVLHPSLMDAALQASIGLIIGSVTTRNEVHLKPILPFALEELEIFGSYNPIMWAHIRYSVGSKAGDKVQKLDLDLCDAQGNVCVRMKGLSSRVLEGEVSNAGPAVTLGTLLLHPWWQEKTIAEKTSAPDYAGHLVMFCESGEISRESIKKHMEGVRCLTLESLPQSIEERFESCTAQIFEEIRNILNDKPKGNVLIQVVVPTQDEQQLFTGLSGLLKTAQLENPKLIGQLIEVEPGEDSEKIVEKLKKNSRSPLDNQIRYQDGKRYVAGWSEVEVSPEEVKIPWKDQGVYLITGGAGGLGLIFAREIAHKVKDATLILTGRSTLNEDKQAKLKELAALGVRIVYKKVDVTQEKVVADLIQSIREDFRGLHGIIHAAGVIKDNFIIKKTKEELQAVLAPKVTGLVHLDQASKDLPLDFFILFSSGAGALGNIGQADYASANAFMDAYAKYRNNLVASKQRHGQTLSINWPLWQEGGMYVDAELEKIVRQNTGMVSMQTPSGIRALYQGLASGKEQVMVVEGDIKRLKVVLLEQLDGTEFLKAPSTTEENKAVPDMAQDLLRERTINYFKKMLSSIIKLPAHRIEADVPLEEYGVDSITAIQMAKQLEKTFGSLSKTLLFEYQNIKDLTGYFLETYQGQLRELLGLVEKAAATATNSTNSTSFAESPKLPDNNHRRSRFAFHRIESQNEKGALDIAIIGVSGRYPGAANIQKFWKNLQNGKDCITEIPKDRWDHGLYFDEDKNKPGKAYCKWGGFLENVDQFDPLFFNISPRDAEIMDPMDRLFLETTWDLLESTGYTREILQRQYQAKVGVYVGAMYQQYHSFDADIVKESAISLSSYSSIANRVSHYFNFQGPSVAIDTMCSSAAIAIHMACEGMIRGECHIAIAGGVNLSIHPKKYLGLSLTQIIGSHIDSRSFGDGDGYLPAEGVGAVLLKPLAKAIQDRDSILAVIKSTAINHNGHTYGLAPNPNAQAQLIEDNLIKSGINPRTVSYVESGANGSALGDSIEITALNKAFQKFTTDKQFCAIGSVKSNIGHAEAASGISQLTKVILQLQHKQLVPIIKAEPLNPNISFNNTPFYLQRELQEWKRPVVMINGEEREFPRRAAISSFGAGGSNAHLLVEEYIPDKEETIHVPAVIQPQIVVFSAKNRDRLQAVAEQMIEFIELQEELSLTDLAFTLQVGREAMEERLAIVVKTRKELVQGLRDFLKSNKEDNEIESAIPVFMGDLAEDYSQIRNLLSGKAGETVVQAFLAENNLEKIAMYWTQGGKIPWEKLYEGQEVRKICLPTYPFARDRYWLSTNEITNYRSDLTRQSEGEKSKFTINPDKSTQENILSYITQFFSLELRLAPEQIKLNKNIDDYGINSITAMKLIRDFEKQFQTKITQRDLLEYSTFKSLATYLARKIDNQNSKENEQVVTMQPEMSSQEMNEQVDGQVIAALEKFSQGQLDIIGVRKLIDGEE